MLSLAILLAIVPGLWVLNWVVDSVFTIFGFTVMDPLQPLVPMDGRTRPDPQGFPVIPPLAKRYVRRPPPRAENDPA